MNDYFTFLFLLSLMAGLGQPVSGQTISPTGPAALTLTQANRHPNPDYPAVIPASTVGAHPETVGGKPVARPLFALMGHFRWLRRKRTDQEYVRTKPPERYQPGEHMLPTPNEGQVNVLPDGRWMINRFEFGHLNNRTLLGQPGYDVFSPFRP